jgi:DNA-binding transcriptional MerR regulator
MEGFTAGEAVRVSGVPYQRLDYWARSGFAPPSLRRASGKGSDRRYSFNDLVALRVANELRKQGVSLQKLRKVVRFLHRYKGEDAHLGSARLLVSGDDVFIYESDEQVVSALQEPGQAVMAFVINLGAIAEAVRQQIHELRSAVRRAQA